MIKHRKKRANRHFLVFLGIMIFTATFITAILPITDIPVYAEGEQYDLVYDPNGGTGTMDNITVTNGDTYYFPECTFTPPSKKIFDHWKMTGSDGIHIPNTPSGHIVIATNNLSEGKIKVTAYWKDAPQAVVTTKPHGRTLTYNGTGQALVSAGEAENGTMIYTVGNDDTTVPDTGWSNVIPTRSETGTYYVWYRAKGNAGFAYSDPECTTATISDKDPVKVKGVSLSTEKLTLKPEESGQIRAIIDPENATDQTVSWNSGSENIAKIASDGRECTVTAVSAGQTTVTVTTEDGQKKAVCTVIVENKPDPGPDKCTISFDANGGKGEMDGQTVNKGTDTQLNRNNFTREGYSFNSWNTKPDGSGNSHDDCDTVNVSEDLTLYAQWKKNDENHTDDDNDDEDDEVSSPAPISRPVNPNALLPYSFISNGGTLSNVKIGPQIQGDLAQLAFRLHLPNGWKEALTFNMTVNDKADYSPKKGSLSFRIPSQYQSAGRKFAILGLDKTGTVKMFTDRDLRADFITVNIDIEGYAFDLIYTD